MFETLLLSGEHETHACCGYECINVGSEFAVYSLVARITNASGVEIIHWCWSRSLTIPKYSLANN